MGEAREVMDRATRALLDLDVDALAACYAEDAVVVTPDQGQVRGREAIRAFFARQVDAFPDSGYESLHQHEAGDVAVDEGFVTGTHTGPLRTPSGESVAPTGRQIRLRACDVATVHGGRITAHHFYFDQMELLGQLGMLPDAPS